MKEISYSEVYVLIKQKIENNPNSIFSNQEIQNFFLNNFMVDNKKLSLWISKILQDLKKEQKVFNFSRSLWTNDKNKLTLLKDDVFLNETLGISNWMYSGETLLWKLGISNQMNFKKIIILDKELKDILIKNKKNNIIYLIDKINSEYIVINRNKYRNYFYKNSKSILISNNKILFEELISSKGKYYMSIFEAYYKIFLDFILYDNYQQIYSEEDLLKIINFSNEFNINLLILFSKFISLNEENIKISLSKILEKLNFISKHEKRTKTIFN